MGIMQNSQLDNVTTTKVQHEYIPQSLLVAQKKNMGDIGNGAALHYTRLIQFCEGSVVMV